MLDAGSELDMCETEQGRSPLFAAIHQNNAPVVKLLVHAGINIYFYLCYTIKPRIHVSDSGNGILYGRMDSGTVMRYCVYVSGAFNFVYYTMHTAIY